MEIGKSYTDPAPRLEELGLDLRLGKSTWYLDLGKSKRGMEMSKVSEESPTSAIPHITDTRWMDFFR